MKGWTEFGRGSLKDGLPILDKPPPQYLPVCISDWNCFGLCEVLCTVDKIFWICLTFIMRVSVTEVVAVSAGIFKWSYVTPCEWTVLKLRSVSLHYNIWWFCMIITKRMTLVFLHPWVLFLCITMSYCVFLPCIHTCPRLSFSISLKAEKNTWQDYYCMFDACLFGYMYMYTQTCPCASRLV